MLSQVSASIRRITATFLTDTCLLEQETNTRGEYGEPTHDWSITAEDVPCRLILVGQRYGSGIAEAAARETMKHEYRLIVARTVKLSTNMRATINGEVFNITRIETALTDEAFHAAVLQRRD